MDKLEEYIKRNRKDLDKYKPSHSVWKGIKKEMGSIRPAIKYWVSIAAMFVVIAGSAVILLKSRENKQYSETGISRLGRLTPSNPELKETEIYYTNILTSLYREATPLLTANPDINEELTYDISQLDSICMEIKRDLKDNIASQEVVEALIQNYRIKIDLLEDVLSILKENDDNKRKNNNHEL